MNKAKTTAVDITILFTPSSVLINSMHFRMISSLVGTAGFSLLFFAGVFSF